MVITFNPRPADEVAVRVEQRVPHGFRVGQDERDRVDVAAVAAGSAAVPDVLQLLPRCALARIAGQHHVAQQPHQRLDLLEHQAAFRDTPHAVVVQVRRSRRIGVKMGNLANQPAEAVVEEARDGRAGHGRVGIAGIHAAELSPSVEVLDRKRSQIVDLDQPVPGVVLVPVVPVEDEVADDVVDVRRLDRSAPFVADQAVDLIRKIGIVVREAVRIVIAVEIEVAGFPEAAILGIAAGL